MKYALDTNLYIFAIRHEGFGQALDWFTSARLPSIHLHAVVVQELLAGAIDAEKERSIQADLVAPFERRGRLITPSWRAWKRAGEVLARLIQLRLLPPGRVSPSVPNDCLLAASCRESGITLITANLRDFELIRRIEPVSILPPWPE